MAPATKPSIGPQTATEPYPLGMPMEDRIPVGAVPVPEHEHEWVESLRYLPWGELEPHDTEEPPKGTTDPETGKPREMALYDPEEHGGTFDPELHYQVGQPGPEIVSFCAVCSETLVQKVKPSAYKRFKERVESGEIWPEHVSLRPLDELLGEGWAAK